MDYVGYSTPESLAKEYLDPEVAESPLHYPSQETLSRTQIFVNLPEETSREVDRLWAEVKMGGPGESAAGDHGGFLGVYIAIIIYKRRKRKRELA